MLISGITKDQFAQAVEKAGILYSDNLRPEFGTVYSDKRFRARVLLEQTGHQMGLPTTVLALGQKRSWSNTRRVPAVCWHVYRDVLIEVFNINPDAKVTTAYAKYYGAQAFYELFPATGAINIGSMTFPVTPRECCDCDC